MTFKKIALAAVAIGALGLAAPASAWGGGHGSSTSGWSSSGGHKPKPPVSSSSGGGHTSTSSGGTKVPEPGMLGIFGAGVAAVGFAQARRRRRKG